MQGNPPWGSWLQQVSQCYNWQPINVTKVRGIYQVQTSREHFALKPIKADKTRLMFLDSIVRHLQEQHYTYLLPWIKTKYGDAFYVSNGGAFYATPWFGKEWSASTDIPDDALIQSLAELHRLTENADLSKDDTAAQTLEKMAEQWDKQIELMQSYAEVAQKREFASPFDVAFLAGVDELQQAASFAINGLKQMSERDKDKPFRRVFCHRRVHPHNLVHHQSNWKWIDFAHAGGDVPARDLAAYMQNFPLEGGENSVAMLKSRLTAYETTFPLKLREKQLLCLLLAYPQNVVKWLNRYYKRKRTRDEMFYVQGLEKAYHYFQDLKRFVKQAWPRGKTAEN